MKFRVVIACVVATAVTGCQTVKLTPEGAAVRPVTDSQKESLCQFIDIVEGAGYPLTGGMQEAMINTRNKVAVRGGNGMHIISTRCDKRGDYCYSYVTAEALVCKF